MSVEPAPSRKRPRAHYRELAERKVARKPKLNKRADRSVLIERFIIEGCIGDANLEEAMAAFDRIQASGNAADMGVFTSLLSLCVTRSDRDAASRVYDAMMGSAKRGGMKGMENAVTSMIRVSCIVGDVAAAERYLDSLIGGGGRPRLRTFSPLIVAHARCGNLRDTFRFFHAARARGLQPAEPEFRALFLAASSNGRPDLAEAVLDDAKTVLYSMGPDFAGEVANWYRSGRGGADDAGRWTVHNTAVTARAGSCGACGRTLRSVELRPPELAAMASEVKALACTNERRAKAMRSFEAWLDAFARRGNAPPEPAPAAANDAGPCIVRDRALCGDAAAVVPVKPFHVILDGANIGYFGQNRAGGSFQYTQVDAVVRAFQRLGCRVLLVLHQKYFPWRYARRGHGRRRGRKAESGGGAESTSTDAYGTAATGPPAAVRPHAGSAVSEEDRRALDIDLTGRAVGTAPGGDVVFRPVGRQARQKMKREQLRRVEALRSTQAPQAGQAGTVGGPAAAAAAAAAGSRDTASTPAPAPAATSTAAAGAATAVGASPGGPSPREVESKGTPPPAPPAQTASERIANRWEADGILYASPAGANDDWFWLYAATVLGDGWHVVTNDQMKDHHWQMLGPRSFLQWRERHVVNFGFYADESGAYVPTFRAPLPYSHRTQRDSGCEDSAQCRVQSVPAAFTKPEDALEYVEEVPHGTRGWHIPVQRAEAAAATAATATAGNGGGDAGTTGEEGAVDTSWLCIRRCSGDE